MHARSIISLSLLLSLTACDANDSSELRKAGSDDLSCEVNVLDSSTDETKTEVFPFKTSKLKGPVTFSFEGSEFVLERNNKNGATTIELKSSKADITGVVTGRIKPGEFLLLETINDFASGDGSDTSVTCELGGKQKKLKGKKLHCKTLGEDGDDPQTVTAVVPDAVGFEISPLGVEVDKNRVIHVTTQEHNSIFASGFGTKQVPLRYPNLECFVQ